MHMGIVLRRAGNEVRTIYIRVEDKGYIVVGGQKAFSMVEGLCMVIDANIVPIGVWLPCSAPQAHFIQIDLPVQSYDHMQLLPMDTPILLPIQN